MCLYRNRKTSEATKSDEVALLDVHLLTSDAREGLPKNALSTRCVRLRVCLRHVLFVLTIVWLMYCLCVSVRLKYVSRLHTNSALHIPTQTGNKYYAGPAHRPVYTHCLRRLRVRE